MMATSIPKLLTERMGPQAHNSSDDSSATIRHEVNSPNVCHSPSSTFSGKSSPSHGKAPAAVTDQPQLPSGAPIPSSEPAGKKAGTATAAHASTSLEPLCPPDASEGPEAAAEYEAYIKRFAAGETLAQRWERLEANGKAADLKEDWEDLQLDIIIQLHCSNTAAAAAAAAANAAAIAAEAAAVATAGTEKRPMRGGTRRSRLNVEVDWSGGDGAGEYVAGGLTGAEGAALSPGARRVRSRQAPKAFRDFEVDLPTAAKSGKDSPTPEPAAAAAGGSFGAAAAVFFPAGSQAPQQQQQDIDAYIGAGILLDLCQSSQPTQKPQQQQQQKQQQTQVSLQQQPVQPVQHKPQQQQQQQQQRQGSEQLPPLPMRSKPSIVLDLSNSPRGSPTPPATASAAISKGSSSALAVAGRVTATPTAPGSLPTVTQPTGQQQQQQQVGMQAEQVQTALQVASQLGAALRHDCETFAQVLSFISLKGNNPTELYQFMATTLSQLQHGNATAAAAAPAAAVQAAAAAASKPVTQQKQQKQQQQKQQQLGLML